jgi:hypothetical protein
MYRNNVVIGYCGHGFHEECINNKSINNYAELEDEWKKINIVINFTFEHGLQRSC